MLTGGVIHAAESGSGAVPEGFVISPEPGAQQSVSTITFCVKGAPGFDILRTGELAGNYITVTSPSGESNDYGIYALPSEDASNGNFYADPVFSEAGEWTVTTHFQKVQYMDQSWTFVNLPEAWQEFTFSYTVSEASEIPESGFMEVPEGGVWSESGPGTYLGTFTGYATLDLSEIYSSIELTDLSAQAMVLSTFDQGLGSLTTTWQNDEHTKIRVRFTRDDATYGFGTFYVALPTAGKATLLNGETVDLKDMKAGPWIREKSTTTPTLKVTPSGSVDATAMPTQLTVTAPKYTGGTTLEVDTDKLDNVTVTDPEGVTTALPAGTFNGDLTITYPLTGDWYTGPGAYTFSFSYEPLSGYTPTIDFVFPEEPLTWTLTVIEQGVSPDAPVMKLDGAEFTKTSYQIEEGTSVTVDLSVTAEDVEIYYRWTPAETTVALEGTSEFVKYETPLTIAERGTLEYYASKGYPQSATKTVKFTLLQVLTEDDFVITPEPGKYEEITADRIVMTANNESLDLLDLYFEDIMTVTDPKGEKHSYSANMDFTKFNSIYFDVAGLFEEEGTYTVDLNFDGYTFYVSSGVKARINPISFTYQIDTETGVGEIADESGDAVYYDLNGHRVHGNLLPGIYIVHENGKVYKRLIK